jgi:hypothetical protein
VIRYWIKEPGPRGTFGQYIAFLWRLGQSCDTDGNAEDASDRNWTELTIINREDESERVDVDPRPETPLTLEVRSARGYLAARLAYALTVTTGGTLLSKPHGIAMDTAALLSMMGHFDVGAALERFERSA